MHIEMFDPDTLPVPGGYHQVVVASGTRTVYLSGQVAHRQDGSLVGEGDLAAQIEQAYLNIAAGLASVGGSFDDVVRITVYVVDWNPDMIDGLRDGIRAAATRLGVDTRKAMTLIGVVALAEPDLLVEIDVIAVLP
jgi:enamine deaminase RidA (YjgF/YER057c/UK114 family)